MHGELVVAENGLVSSGLPALPALVETAGNNALFAWDEFFAVSDLVFTSTYDGTVHALLRSDGRVVWTYRATARIIAPLAVAQDTILVPAGYRRYVYKGSDMDYYSYEQRWSAHYADHKKNWGFLASKPGADRQPTRSH